MSQAHGPTASGPSRPLAIDLFSGCGGLTLGLKQAGFDVVGAVELNDLAVETYRRNHRKVKLWHGDIRKLPPRRVLLSLGLKSGQLDLLAGCPPCQGFSALRTLNGRTRVRDRRNDLVFQFIRFAKILEPKTLMMENVPRLAGNRRFRELCDRLTKLGYVCSHRILDAARFGVPQRRKRLILLASRTRDIPFAKPTTQSRTVRQTIGQLPKPNASKDKLHSATEKHSPNVVKLIRLIPKNGGSRTDLPRRLQLKCHRSCTGFKDVYGRMAFDEVAPTITSGCVNPSKGRFLHPTQNRAITLREAALLQGFPRHYFFSLTKGKFAVAEMIGNALPPEFIRRHARVIRKHLLFPKAPGAA